MPIKPGDRMPDGELLTMDRDGPRPVATADYFAGRRVVLFAVPGAFTPTCSDAHLPGFLANSEEIREKGVDVIACLAVNDVFVMEAWRRQSGAAGHIEMLADGNGDYVRALGLELDLSRFKMGKRSQRFAAVIEDGVVQALGVEDGPEVEQSSAEAILAKL